MGGPHPAQSHGPGGGALSRTLSVFVSITLSVFVSITLSVFVSITLSVFVSPHI